jgi:hypothetical protein
VTIFDGREASAAGTTLYYISSYRESHRFHTKKQAYIHVNQREEKDVGGKDDKSNKLGKQCQLMHKARTENIRTKYEWIKHHAYSMRLTGGVTIYTLLY